MERQTGRRPKELIEIPELWRENETSVEAWRFLSNGADRVPLSEIEVYARLHKLDPVELATKIRAMERELSRCRG